MSRCYFQTARSKLNVYVSVFDDRNDASYERYNHFLSFQPTVFGVFGVDAHRGIAHDGFRTCGGHDGITSFGILVNHLAFHSRGCTGVFGNVVFQVVEFALLFTINDFLVGEGRLGFGVPVDHAQSTIDEPFVIEVYKHLEHALGTRFVHGEGRAIPVARCAQPAKLLEDDASVLFRPFPCVLQELLAGEVHLADALLCQFVHHLGLCSNRGVVGAGYPAGVFTFHPCAAHKNVLNGVVEHVAHVEHSRHVGGRNHDGIRLAAIGF